MDNTIHYSLPKVAQLFSQHIHTHSFHLDGTDAASVLEWLYLCYTESQERDPPRNRPNLPLLRHTLRKATPGRQ